MSAARRHHGTRRGLTLGSLLAVAVAGCDPQPPAPPAATPPSDTAPAAAARPSDPAATAASKSSLAELCALHETDKCGGHNYVELYEKFFEPIRFEAERVFEIGVWRGASMRLWADYFANARIFGIDVKDTSEYDTDRITTFIADQSDREQLRAFIETHGGDFDVIIDDGGHSMEQQQVSFGYLFPFVRPGGYYVIEDTHTSFLDPEKRPRYGVDMERENTTFHMVERFIWTRSFESPYLTRREETYLDQHVASCLYWLRAPGVHTDLFLCRKQGGGTPSAGR